MKRKSSIKNTGNILPGHGGILDRIDGILLGVTNWFNLFSYISFYEMKKKLSITGCTGSIGDTTFKLFKKIIKNMNFIFLQDIKILKKLITKLKTINLSFFYNF